MQEEVFSTQREFNNRFPSKMYICSNCGELSEDKYTCRKCHWRADGLLKTWGKGYKYTILETGITEEIFKPIELLRKEEKMSTVVLTENVDCSTCIYFELEGIEGVCKHFGMVIEDPEPLCSAYEKKEESEEE